MFADHGLDFPLAEWAKDIGRGAADPGMTPYEILKSKLPYEIDIATERLKRRQRNDQLILNNTMLPGVLSLLDDSLTFDLKIGLASSSSLEWVQGHLKRLGILHRFHCLRCSDHVTKTKPDPELYLSVLSAFGILPSEAIAFEDSRNGSLAAKSAKLFTIVVPNEVTRRSDLSHADQKLESLSDFSLSQIFRTNSSFTQTVAS